MVVDLHRQYQISFWVSNVFCQYLAKAKMAHAIAKRRIIEEDLYECGLDVHHYLFFVCASILRMIRIISAQNMSLNVFSEIDSFAQKTTLPVIFLTNLC